MSVPVEAIYAKLTQIFRRVFVEPDVTVTPDSTSQTITGWDSFKYVQVILELEVAYGIELDGPEIDEVSNVGDLVRLVEGKIAGIG